MPAENHPDDLRPQDLALSDAAQGSSDVSALSEQSVKTLVDSSTTGLNPTIAARTEGLAGMTLDGRYMVEKELSHGGIGVVYLARDLKLMGKPVVVKVLREDALRDEYVVRKFHHEKEALARLDHPGIVGILDAGELPDGKSYIVMQYVDGVTLRSVMRPEGMGLERTACVLKQVGSALSAAHERGVYHRDLKPENIMLQALDGSAEQVKIIDFGIARIRNSQVAPSTIGTVTAGTIAYMSPEQLQHEKVTAASDIYTLGIIAYEMVTGRRPFNPETEFQLLEMQRAGVRVKPKDLRPALTDAAQEVILKSLSFNPKDRYRNANEFGNALEKALIGSDEGSACEPSEEISTLEIPHQVAAPVRQKRYGKLWTACAATLLVAGIIGLILWWQLNPGTGRQTDRSGTVNSAPSSERSLNYWLTVQKMRDDKAFQEPFESSGQEVFENGYKFRFNAVSPQMGYLYLLNEGLSEVGAKSFTLLYPTPVRNGGSAQLEANQLMQTGWNTFGGLAGTEQFWMIWAATPVPALEAARETAFKNEKGALTNAAQAQKVREFLLAAQKPSITKDKIKRQTVVRATGEILVNLVELEHR